MELLVIVAILLVLAVAAPRWGVDSRDDFAAPARDDFAAPARDLHASFARIDRDDFGTPVRTRFATSAPAAAEPRVASSRKPSPPEFATALPDRGRAERTKFATALSAGNGAW
jgi:hypothetical protein